MTVYEDICLKDWQKQMLNKTARNKIIKKHSLMKQFIIKYLDEDLPIGNCLYWKYRKRQASLGVKHKC